MKRKLIHMMIMSCPLALLETQIRLKLLRYVSMELGACVDICIGEVEMMKIRLELSYLGSLVR